MTDVSDSLPANSRILKKEPIFVIDTLNPKLPGAAISPRRQCPLIFTTVATSTPKHSRS